MELDAVEQRVLGCLLEKASTTPQAYPLTLNALRLACNQSTNRDPIVDYDEPAVDAALTSLRAQGITRVVYSPSNRAAKHRHILHEILELEPAEVAVLAVLLLRGGQTVGEIKGRTERLHPFATLAEVEATLERLARRPDPLVREHDRRRGQKDSRWTHLLGPASPPDRSDPDPEAAIETDRPDRDPPGRATEVRDAAGLADLRQLEVVVSGLADQVEALRTELDRVREELGL